MMPLMVMLLAMMMMIVVEAPLTGAHGSVGGGPRVVVSTAALHARARGSVPGLGGLK